MSGKSVLFDLYGTLVDVRLDEDTPALWNGLSEAIRNLGGAAGSTAAATRRRFLHILAEETPRREHGFVMEAVFARVLESSGARPDVAHVGKVFRRLSTTELRIRAYVEPIFAALRRHSYPFAIVSNTEAVLTRADFERCPILLSADAIVLSSEVGVRKPDSRIFHIALDRLHAEPSSAVFVGNDLVDDVGGARRAGLQAVYLDETAAGVERMTKDGSTLRAAPTGAAVTAALELLGYSLS